MFENGGSDALAVVDGTESRRVIGLLTEAVCAAPLQRGTGPAAAGVVGGVARLLSRASSAPVIATSIATSRAPAAAITASPAGPAPARFRRVPAGAEPGVVERQRHPVQQHPADRDAQPARIAAVPGQMRRDEAARSQRGSCRQPSQPPAAALPATTRSAGASSVVAERPARASSRACSAASVGPPVSSGAQAARPPDAQRRSRRQRGAARRAREGGAVAGVEVALGRQVLGQQHVVRRQFDMPVLDRGDRALARWWRR